MRVLAILILLYLASAAPAQGEIVIAPVAGRVHVIDGATDRIGVSAGPDGVLMIDGGYMATLADVKKAVASLGRGEPKTLVNTHWHHAFANPGFADATIIAHRNVAKRMLKPNLMFNRIVAVPPPEGLPDATFDGSHSLTFNGERIDIVGFAPAHTDSDAVVIFRTSKVVFTGDLFVPHLPWIDYGSGGSVQGLLDAVDRLVEIVPRDAILIPGHGASSRHADLVAYRSAVHELVAWLRAQIGRGATLAEIQKTGVPHKLSRWVKAGGIPANLVLESFYKGLHEPAPGDDCEFVNGRWFDGRAFVPQAGFWTSAGTLTDKRPESVECAVDLGDKFVIPPFADAHTHKLGTEASARSDGAALVASGVFYAMVQDPAHEVTAGLRQLTRRPEALEAIYTQGVVTASWGVIPDFYRLMAERGMLGRGMTYEAARDNLFFTIDNTAELERKWPQLAAKNDRFVKVILAFSDQLDRRRRNPKYDAKPPQYSKKPGFDPALMPELVARAHRAGLKVSAHVETAADFRVAVAAGADFIAHLPGSWQIGRDAGFDSDDLAPWKLTRADAAAAKAKGVKVITTAFRKPDHMNAALFRQAHRHNLRMLADAGVALMTGTDAFEETVVDELLYLEKLGVLDRAQLLDIATRQTTQSLFPERKLGKLKNGFEASFLVYESDPMTASQELKTPLLRVKAGQILP